MSDTSDKPEGPGSDWRDQRRAERQERWRERREMHWGRGGPWIGGVILIAVGVVFMLKNLGVPIPQNWWAIFLLLPAAGALATAWSAYRRDGAMTSNVIGALVIGLVLAVLGITFLAGFDWGRLWPIILIVLGIGVLAGGYRRR